MRLRVIPAKEIDKEAGPRRSSWLTSPLALPLPGSWDFRTLMTGGWRVNQVCHERGGRREKDSMRKPVNRLIFLLLHWRKWLVKATCPIQERAQRAMAIARRAYSWQCYPTVVDSPIGQWLKTAVASRGLVMIHTVMGSRPLCWRWVGVCLLFRFGVSVLDPHSSLVFCLGL